MRAGNRLKILIGTALVLCSVGAGTVTTAEPALAQARVAGCPTPPAPHTPANPAFYDFVNTYRSGCASTRNWDRSFRDSTIRTTIDGRTPVSVTTSTALGAAIASVKVDRKEYIASGGHGAALQYNFHAWKAGSSPTECYNPTQAGAHQDDVDQPPPFHGPSTSALYEHRAQGATIRSNSRLAMYMTHDDQRKGWNGCRATDFQPDRSPYTLGLSPYWLRPSVQLAPDHGLGGLDNVIRLSADLTSEDTLHENFDAVLIAYLQRDFSTSFAVDPARGTLAPQNEASQRPTARCTTDGKHCLGMYFRPSKMGSAYYYLQTRGPSDYNGGFGEYTTQVTVPATNVGVGGSTRLSYEVFLVVGDKERVGGTIRELARRLA